MLQVIIWMLCVYLVVKGVEVLQIALASARPKRTGIIVVGALTLVACVVAAAFFMMLSTTMAADVPDLSRY